ncbi:MAG: alpha/beta hydrolase [Actinobacteria bacterium]|nr:alpha/beta hydrolase [Actinomycetota bacterium]
MIVETQHSDRERTGEGIPGYPHLPEGRWIEVDGLRTWYAEAGEGDPLVLVYGGNFGPPEFGGGDGANQWDSCVERLAASHRVIVYDKPGMGWTDAPKNDEDYSMAFVVSHLIALLEALECGPVGLVGHSRGGYIATRAALLRQDLVRTLTIVNSGTLSPGVGTNAVALADVAHQGDEREAIRWSLETYTHDPSCVDTDWVETNITLLEAPGHLRAVERIEAGNLMLDRFYPELARDKRETLTWLAEGRLQRPTQIFWGRNDRTAPLALGRELFEGLSRHEPRTRFEVIDACGHFPYREHPEWFVGRLRSFLEEVGRDEG